MSARTSRSQLSLLLVLGAACFAALPALALQPLQEFLDGAKKNSVDVIEATANLEQQDALADVQLGQALPGIQLRGTYTRNQYPSEVTFPATAAIPAMGTTPAVPAMPATTYTIQPTDQFDAYGIINVPLINLAQFKRISSARRGTDVTRKQLEATLLQTSGMVAQDYYQLVANLALVEASKRQLEVSRASLALSQDKYNLGSAPELDVDRARSDVEALVQQQASAELQVAIAERALQTVSGMTPQLTGNPDFNQDLHQEAPLDELEKSVGSIPQVQAAVIGVDQADANATAQQFTLIPALAASFTEHLENASGFVGSDASYTFVLALTWQFDYTTVANIRAQNAAADAARAREQRARLAASDEISRDWNTVRAAIARSQSARVQVKTSEHASDLALDRYKAGAATQLDLLQAQRDAFSAEVSRIQADADLANSRAQLRLSVGKTLDDVAPATAPTATPAR